MLTQPGDLSLITQEELDLVLKQLKANKTPGPDCTIAEMYKALDSTGRQWLLYVINQRWHSEQVDHNMTKAYVALIFKKGNVQDPANYRSISLLNTFL